jgi:hypothetical protein
VRRAGFERRLRNALRAARAPRAADAERRAWHVVRAAHAARVPARGAHRARRLGLAAAAAAVALGALVLTPAGAKMGDWIGEMVDPPDATSVSLGPLPAKGRMLVVADSGAWIVQDDGARRRLGSFRDATWSPGGLFVAAARGHELVALEPDGDERWARPAPGRVSVPRWSPDGYRIAYRSGRDLWIVTGDNDSRWRLARGVRSTPPAWKPVPEPLPQVVAFAAGGRVRIVEADAPGRTLGATPPGPPPREIWWADAGRRLVTVASRGVRVHDSRGRLLRTIALPRGRVSAGSAIAPDGRRLAIIARRPADRSSELLLMRLDRRARPRDLLSALGSFEGLTWSIDGRLLVLGLPDSGQWYFVRPRRSGGLESVAGVRRRFTGGVEPRTGAFPRPAGWCYAEPASRRASGQPPCSSGSAP